MSVSPDTSVVCDSSHCAFVGLLPSRPPILLERLARQIGRRRLLHFFASSRRIVARSQAPSASSSSCCVPRRYKDAIVSPVGDNGI
jgi:hypothetical protein